MNVRYVCNVLFINAINFVSEVTSVLILTSDVQASVFRASGRLKPYIFCDFELQAGSGSAIFA